MNILMNIAGKTVLVAEVMAELKEQLDASKEMIHMQKLGDGRSISVVLLEPDESIHELIVNGRDTIARRQALAKSDKAPTGFWAGLRGLLRWRTRP